MTPKQLLNKMEDEMVKSVVPEVKEILRAQYEGALAMYECFLEKQRKYYETHREHNREYQRVYQQARRTKAKEVEK